MSLLGFNAVGRLALGQVSGGLTTAYFSVSAGAFTFTAFPVSFTITEAVSAGSVALAGVASSFTISETAASGAFAVAPKTVSFKITERIVAGAFTMNGQPVNEIIMEAEGPASFVVAGNDAALSRTGFDYDFQQGGIGHLLMEMQRAKQLAAITRTIPPPVDRRTAPTFRPVARPQAAPIAQAVDMAAIQKQRTDEAAAASRAAKKRREEEAILLLAS
jgi:hypothetical protein